MKTVITLLLILVMTMSLVAHRGTENTKNFETNAMSEITETSNEVILTKDNIGNYIQFDGEFVDGKYTEDIVNWAEATLQFQAYPVVAGTFSNVEITVRASSNAHAFTYMNSYGNYWHLYGADKETKNIEFTFKLGVDGKFSKNYAVECLNNTGILKGTSDITVISVSGTYISN